MPCVCSTLPYICRKVAPDRVKISRVSQRLRFAAFPARHTHALAERLHLQDRAFFYSALRELAVEGLVTPPSTTSTWPVM